MQENILNISRTVYAVTYPASHNLEDIYKGTHFQRSEPYNTSFFNSTKSANLATQSLDRTFFSPNLKENSKQYFSRNHTVKQEPVCTDYDGK